MTGDADENGWDENNSSSVVVEGTMLLACGDQAPLLVKGGSVLTTEGAGVIVIDKPAKARVHLLVDDWSDQSKEPSIVDGKIVTKDGSPLRYAFGRRRRPKISGPSECDWPYTIGLHAYNPFKALVRFVLRIPRGVKGPSWL